MRSSIALAVRRAATQSPFIRPIPAVVLIPAFSIRSIHASQPVLKKRKNAILDDSPFSDDLDPSENTADSEDLFDISSLPTSSNTSSTATRSELIQHLRDTLALESKERKRATSSELRMDTLARIVQLSAQSEGEKLRDVEGLKGMLRGWRMLGMKVRPEVGEEIVEKCIAAGRPDLGQLYSSDRIQFGLPELSAPTTARLSEALASFVSADDGPGGEALGEVEPKA